MKSMIWKELRENARWGALAFFALLLGEIYALSGMRSGYFGMTSGIALCGSTFLFVSAFGCCAVGAMLGMVQILPELRRDQWASLLHRPVPRSAIFFGKVVAGLLIYIAATGLPLLVSMGYVALPGRVPAPFLPQTAIPATSDLLLGGVFYFAALLLALHRGRWVGSKAIIVLGAVAILMLHLAGGWPFLLPVLAMVVLFLAAWGAMEGSLGLRPRLSVWALGLFLLLGAQTALLMIGAALHGLQRDSSRDLSTTRMVIAFDGAVMLSTSSGKDRSTVLTDMEGKPITDERYTSNGQYNNELYPSNLANRERASFGGYWWRARSSEDWVELLTFNYGTPELWYLIKGQRSYFVGYDRMSGRCLGYCDADGFKGADAPIRPFASEPQGERVQNLPCLYWVGSKLFTVDFGDRQLTPIADFGSERIYGALRYPNNADQTRIAVALESEIRFFDSHGALLTSTPYAHDLHQWPVIGITATADFSRTFVQYAPDYFTYTPGRPLVQHLDAFDGQMQRIASYTHDETIFVMPTTWVEYFGYLTNMPVPSWYWTLRTQMAEAAGKRPEPTFSDTIVASVVGLDMGNRSISMLCGFAVLLGVGAGVWARRVGLTRGQTIGWIATTLVFGLPGFLAFRMCTAWPTQVRCPQCGQLRPAEAEACPRCRQIWQAVAPTGAEIFEVA
jgi:hypothetical protein